MKKPRSLRKRSIVSEVDVDTFVSSGKYVFWLAHGANYLASSLEQGLWRPLFGGIYRGVCYTPDSIRQEASVLFRTSEGITPLGSTLLQWCSLPPSKVFSFVQGLQQKATAKQKESLLLPHAEYVWQAFQPLHQVRL